MALFDLVNFNGEVFDAAVCNTPNLRLNELLKSGAIVEHSEYAAMLPDQMGLPQSRRDWEAQPLIMMVTRTSDQPAVEITQWDVLL